ncbi:hypothetical protein [Calothrix sp. PCC 7507]|nr:hypothetical protein [Calothrix sp. PCC 7507]
MALANNSSQGLSRYAIYNAIWQHRQECDYLAGHQGELRRNSEKLPYG